MSVDESEAEAMEQEFGNNRQTELFGGIAKWTGLAFEYNPMNLFLWIFFRKCQK